MQESQNTKVNITNMVRVTNMISLFDHRLVQAGIHPRNTVIVEPVCIALSRQQAPAHFQKPVPFRWTLVLV